MDGGSKQLCAGAPLNSQAIPLRSHLSLINIIFIILENDLANPFESSDPCKFPELLMSQLAPLEGSPQFGGNSYTREKDCLPFRVRNMATGLGAEAPSTLGPGEVVADI